jgi:hypothetical protein
MLGVLPDARRISEMYVNPEESAERERERERELSASYPRVFNIWFGGLLKFHP